MRKFKYFQLGGTVLGEDEQYVEGQTILNPRSIKTRNFWDWLTPWKTQNEKDLEELYNRGFIYQNDQGQLERVGKGYMADGQDLNYKQFSRKVSSANDKIKRAQRLRTQYGLAPGEANMPGSNVRRQFDNGAQTVSITPTQYRVSLSQGRLHNAYKTLLQYLYENKNHKILKQLSNNGRNPINDESITGFLGQNELNDQYLQTLGLNENQRGLILKALPPKDPDNLPALTGTIPQGTNFDVTTYEGLGFGAGLNKEDANYNNQLYNRVQGYRNAHGLAADAAIENPGEMRFHNNYYVFNQGDKDYYVGPSDVYDSEGNKKEFKTQRVIQKKGGIMKYFQTGGSLNRNQIASEQMQQYKQFIINLCKAAETGNLEVLRSMFGITPDKLEGLKSTLAKLSKQKEQNPDIANAAERALKGLNDRATMAKQGTKLDYLRRLRGKCPEGYETEMFKVGGKVGCRCKKRAEEGIKLEDGGESPVVQQFKKGRKCKK